MAASIGRYGFSSSASHSLQNSRTGGWFSGKTVKVLGALAFTSLAIAAIAAVFYRGGSPSELEDARDIQDLTRLGSWWPSFSEAEKHRSLFENCLSSDCTALTEKEMEIRERQALEAIGATGFLNRMKGLFGLSTFEETQELLRLNKNDPRDKLLFFSLDCDNKREALHPKEDLHVLPKLAEKYDIKFKLIRTLDEICRETADAALAGKLAHIVIEGHGSPESMALSWDHSGFSPVLRTITSSRVASFPSCLSALDPAGKIVLSSCCTGSPGTFPDELCFWDKPNFLPADPDYEPFAQKLATLAKREVVGAEVVTGGKDTSIASLDLLMLMHPVKRGKNSPHPEEFQKRVTDPNYNIFKMFRPQYPGCSNPVDRTTVQPREFQALNAIKTDFVAKFLLKRDASFRDTEDWLRLCSEDPRKKMVYLLAKDDPDGTSNLHENKVLPVFADKFDLLVKEVSTADGICHAVRAAAKEAAPDILVIDANGRPGYGLLLQEGEEGGAIAANRDFGKCFAGLKPNARIVLMDGFGGASLRNDPCDALAQKMADSANRLVIAPVGAIDRGSVTVSSTDPVDLHHPAEDSPTGNLYEIFRPGCQPSQHVRDWQPASPGIGATAIKVINASLSALKGLAFLAIHDEMLQHLLEVLGFGAAAIIAVCMRRRRVNSHAQIPNRSIAELQRMLESLSKTKANRV